ncbi:MAG: 2-oxoacid:acceptor oxidoreductase family protein [Bacillota bacterium]
MGRLTEIRWHARGGQGAKTAATLLAEAAAEAGMNVQAFPEYGAERMGAPMRAFNRLSDAAIRVRCHVTQPQVVMVLDATLIGKSAITDGLADDGVVIINTPHTPEEMRRRLGLNGCKVYTVDASAIARETIGRDIPNTPMMGALLKVTKLMDFGKFAEVMGALLSGKFKGKQAVVAGNMAAIERASEEVRGE